VGKNVCPFSITDEGEGACGDWCALYDPSDRHSCGLLSMGDMILEQLRYLRNEIAALKETRR
jgi:hypothetical protein